MPSSNSSMFRRQFLKAMRWGALFSVAVALVAVALVIQGDSSIRIHLLIATALGAGLSVMLGIALMTLMFLSNRMGHDDGAHRSTTSMGAPDAADHHIKDEHDPRA